MHIDSTGKLRGLTKQTLFTEKDLSKNVLITTVTPLYRRCFRYGVWQEDLSIENVVNRLEGCFARDFRGNFLFTIDEQCIGATWYEYVNLDWLAKNKGSDLAYFASQLIMKDHLYHLVWHTETLVDPSFSGLGLATSLKQTVDDRLVASSKADGGILLCTRMRDDNIAILKTNTKLGFQKTGIRMPCNLDPEISHEYWFKIYK